MQVLGVVIAKELNLAIHYCCSENIYSSSLEPEVCQS